MCFVHYFIIPYLERKLLEVTRHTPQICRLFCRSSRICVWFEWWKYVNLSRDFFCAAFSLNWLECEIRTIRTTFMKWKFIRPRKEHQHRNWISSSRKEKKTLDLLAKLVLFCVCDNRLFPRSWKNNLRKHLRNFEQQHSLPRCRLRFLIRLANFAWKNGFRNKTLARNSIVLWWHVSCHTFKIHWKAANDENFSINWHTYDTDNGEKLLLCNISFQTVAAPFKFRREQKKVRNIWRFWLVQVNRAAWRSFVYKYALVHARWVMTTFTQTSL